MACSGDRPASLLSGAASLQHLPHEVMLKILRLVVEAAADKHSTPTETRAWEEAFLVPLRSFCTGLRNAVDVCLTSRSLCVRPKSSRDASALIHIGDWLCHIPRRWPHLTSLQLRVDFPFDYVQFTLLTIARSCTFLARIKLESLGGHDCSGNVKIGVLRSLPSLSALSLQGFARYKNWSEGLGELTSVQELELLDSGLREFESWPELTSLVIDGAEGPNHNRNLKESVRKKESFKLQLEPGLQDLRISRLTIDNLDPPSSLQTLELSEFFCFTTDFEDLENPLTSMKLRDMDYSCIDGLLQLEGLSSLEITGLKNVADDALLHDIPGLTSLVWSKNDGKLPPGISILTDLQTLSLSDSIYFRVPSLEAITGLRSLSISGMPNLVEWPHLRSFTSLLALTLSGDHQMPFGLTALVALEELTLEGSDYLDVARLRPLTRLHRLTLRECNRVSTLPELEHFTSLRKLHLSKLKRLKEVPNLSASLTSLSVAHCPSLRHFPIFSPVNSLRQLTVECLQTVLVSQVTALTSLQELTIQDFPDLPELPRLQSLGCLRSIAVSSCPLVRAIDVRQLPDLRLVGISSCTALKSVKGLTERVKCTTSGCPALQCFNG